VNQLTETRVSNNKEMTQEEKNEIQNIEIGRKKIVQNRNNDKR
jgi:hypothetical protein